MIDEIEENRKYIRDNDQRLSELESQMDVFEHACLIDNGKRIEELEKDNKTTIEIVKEQDNIYFKEIAELRGEDISILTLAQWNKAELNELKEMKKEWDVHGKTHAIIINERDNIKEVLRDDYRFKIDNLPENDLKKHYEGLLAKLDGKKKVEKTDALDSMVHALYPLIDGSEKKEQEEYYDKEFAQYQEASGGEKEYEMVTDPYTKITVPVEKPPEHTKLRTYIDGVDITESRENDEMGEFWNPIVLKNELISEFVEDLNDCFYIDIFNLSMFKHKKRKWEDKLSGGEK